jgi:tyrosinase
MDQQQYPDVWGRRKFIYDVSLTSLSALFLSTLLGGCEEWIKQIQNRPMRRMIGSNAAAGHSVDLYRTAVHAMKNLPDGDCRKWINQAAIHNNFCPHGNWFFFPWHRAYLFEFEKICQELLNDKTFGLPYWNWCMNGHLPAPFWTPPSGNALYNSTRVCTQASIADPLKVGLIVVSPMLDETNFTIFAGGSTTALRPTSAPWGSYGQVEATPHNYIHGSFIQGDMGTYMSPLDPIFWNHHCMIDLCWYEWNVTRNHPNTSDTAWLNFSLAGMFCDGTGTPVDNLTVLTTLLMPLLSYQYETGINGQPSAEKQAMKNKAEFKKMQKIIEAGSKMELRIRKKYELKRGVTFGPQKPASEALTVDAADFTESIRDANKERVIISIKNLTHPPKSDVYVRVFVNKPDANQQTSTDDPHYAGSFFFFTHGGGHGHDENQKKPDYLVDITSTLKRLKSNEVSGGFNNITINLVAVPVEGVVTETTSLTAENIEVLISSVNLELMDIK